MTAMPLALLLALAQAPLPSPTPALVDIRDLSPREHREAVFVLTTAQEVKLSVVGAEPWPDQLRTRDDAHWQDDEQTTWPAAAWILDARTRAVVWDLRAADTRRESNGLRHFAGSVRLPAGTYEAHYAFYPAAAISFTDAVDFRAVVRLARRASGGGPYVDNGLYKQFALTIDGSGHAATADEIEGPRIAFMATAVISVEPKRNSANRRGFELARPTDVEVYAVGELKRDQPFDYGWIVNADTRKHVWTMTYDNTEPAGGAAKNRMAHERLHLRPGRYVAYFVSDDSHAPDDWNAVPATDPESWGLTLRVADRIARAAVRPFEYEPVPEGQTIVSMIGIGDNANRSTGFTLRRPLDVRIYALGESSDREMVDYAWIVDAVEHKRIWTMRYEDTEAAGGSDKNRLFDGVLHLRPGSYFVYYKSDGSHSSNNWNAAPPAEERYWGVSVFPASGRLHRADIAPLERTGRGTGTPLALLIRMGDDENARAPFQLTGRTRLRVYALGEGHDGGMVDYGWIENASGDRVWEMKYDQTDPAGGADKNRVFEGVITLPVGSYVLRYRSDGSHSHADWNDAPPDDPESWGISVFRMDTR